MKLTPLHLSLLVHYHALNEPVPNENAPAVVEYTRQLVAENIIDHSLHSASGYRTTPKGVAWLKLLLSTPFPVQTVEWIDPRSLG